MLTLPCTGAVALELQDVDGTAWPFPGGCHATFQLQPLDANGEEQGLERGPAAEPGAHGQRGERHRGEGAEDYRGTAATVWALWVANWG